MIRSLDKELPYKTHTSARVANSAQAWCQDQWGPRWSAVDRNKPGTWCCFWRGWKANTDMMYEWNFATEQQLFLFRLRWS